MTLYTLEFLHKKMEVIQTDISTRFQFKIIIYRSEVKEFMPFDVLMQTHFFHSA